MGEIVVFALLSAVYPTLIAAATVMLLLPRPERLMLGFWLGAMITSVACGLVTVFAFHGSNAAKTAGHSVSPAVALVIAALLVLAAIALGKREDVRVRERHGTPHPKAKTTPKWQQKLRNGSPRQTFVVGILLSFPGVWYIAALDRLIKLQYSSIVEILVVVGFCLAQLILLEIPMLAFLIWPTETPITIGNAKAWASRHGRQYGAWGLVIAAGALVVIAVIGLVS